MKRCNTLHNSIAASNHLFNLDTAPNSSSKYARSMHSEFPYNFLQNHGFHPRIYFLEAIQDSKIYRRSFFSDTNVVSLLYLNLWTYLRLQYKSILQYFERSLHLLIRLPTKLKHVLF